MTLTKRSFLAFSRWTLDRHVRLGIQIPSSSARIHPAHPLQPTQPRSAVEAALLVRLGNKARLFGAELDAQGNLKGEDQRGEGRIKTDEVVKLYRDWVIPLTKDVEVDYLEHRLEGVGQSQIDEWMRAGEGK
jgi:hypothetical protein